MGIGLTLGHSCHPHFRLISRISNVSMSCFASLERVDESDGLSSNSVGERRMWKKFCSKELGITNSMISKPTRIVLNGLKRQGFDAYLVGGCVRDLILKRPPKDFDVLTTAELKEVRTAFSRCEIVGKRFPICHVHVGDDIVETLFSNMDKLLAPDRPCHSSLWVAILALHMAFLDRPRDPLVVAAFSLAVHNGGDMEEAIGIAKRISTPHATIYAELSDSQYLEPKALKKEVLEFGVSVSTALSNMTDSYYVSQAMRSYPKAPKSDMVFIPLLLYLKAVKIFECVNHGKEARFVAKQGGEIDYKSLAMGNVQEVRHVFARIVFDTIYPLDLDQN